MKHAWEDETCVTVFGWRTRKEKTTQEASGESKLSGGVRMNAGFV